MFLHPSLEQKNGSVIVSINVHPNSSKRSIEMNEYLIEVYVNEPPDKGKANKAVMKLLSNQLKKPNSQITLIKGHKSRKKIILIEDANVEEVYRSLK